MNTKTIINIKADKKVKTQAQDIAQRLGIPLSSIINSFLKQFIRTEEVTFSTATKMTPELEAVLHDVEQDRKRGKNVTKEFSLEEAVKHLSSL
jgi:addiction module RelB/DinJ family antitoxin